MRELIQQLREQEDIFQPASREDYIRRRADAYAELKTKFKPGTKVKYFDPPVDWSYSGRSLEGTVLRVYDPSPPPLRQYGPSMDNVIIDVEFPEINRVYNLHPDQVELLEAKKDIFKPASSKDVIKRQRGVRGLPPKPKVGDGVRWRICLNVVVTLPRSSMTIK